MNIFQTLYCYIYQYNEDNGKVGNSDSSRKTGTIMVSVMVLMWILSIVFLTFPAGLGEGIIDLLQDIFGYKSGKQIGRLLGISLFILIYPCVHFTVGSKKSFQKIIAHYQTLEKEKRGEMAGLGMSYLIISCVVFVISIVIGSIVGMIMG